MSFKQFIAPAAVLFGKGGKVHHAALPLVLAGRGHVLRDGFPVPCRHCDVELAGVGKPGCVLACPQRHAMSLTGVADRYRDRPLMARPLRG